MNRVPIETHSLTTLNRTPQAQVRYHTRGKTISRGHVENRLASAKSRKGHGDKDTMGGEPLRFRVRAPSDAIRHEPQFRKGNENRSRIASRASRTTVQGAWKGEASDQETVWAVRTSAQPQIRSGGSPSRSAKQ